jgi:hypothetical protein
MQVAQVMQTQAQAVVEFTAEVLRPALAVLAW